ncbi:MAG: BA14K family protein [Sphingobium sp.]
MSARLLGALGAILVAVTPMALSAQSRPPVPQPGTPNNNDHQDHRPGGTMQPGRPGSPMQLGRPGAGMESGPGHSYGNWNNEWGARPAAPPRHWSKQGDWYRHVRACQMRYRSYNARTDMFFIRRGVQRRCTL